MKKTFNLNLLVLNNLIDAGFREWLFLPSMLFDSEDKWWSDEGKRAVPHEGIDISMYRTASGVTKYLDRSMRVPAVFSGRVERIINDFLGKSVFISSEHPDAAGGRFFTLYGHIEPLPDIAEGTFIREGDVIGTIAAGKQTTVRPHLHISFARVPDNIALQELDWETIGARKKIQLLNPLDIIELPHFIIDTLKKTGGE
ncbi:MAG: M23 family metallopeptidase [Dehalococcoidales bacterium]|nr:M23 family metallopeptidase [Dehalococcoidales bacterium]